MLRSSIHRSTESPQTGYRRGHPSDLVMTEVYDNNSAYTVGLLTASANIALTTRCLYADAVGDTKTVRYSKIYR